MQFVEPRMAGQVAVPVTEFINVPVTNSLGAVITGKKLLLNNKAKLYL